MSPNILVTKKHYNEACNEEHLKKKEIIGAINPSGPCRAKNLLICRFSCGVRRNGKNLTSITL